MIRSQQIRNLDEKLHEVERLVYAPVPNMGPQPLPWEQKKVPARYLDTDYKMAQDELEMIQAYLERPDTYVIPKNMNFGFSIGFEVIKVRGILPGRHETLCSFVEEQMPANTGWDEMHPYMFNKNNLALAALGGHKLNDDRSCYDY